MQFGFCRFLLGAGEAGNWPGGVKTVAEWVPARSRALAIGFFNSGSSRGAVTAPPAVAWITLQWGLACRVRVHRTARLSVVCRLGGLYHLPQNHPRISRTEMELMPGGESTLPDSVSSAAAHGKRWLALLGHGQVWALVLSRLLADPVWWFYVFWLPEYLTRERHFNLQISATFAGSPSSPEVWATL